MAGGDSRMKFSSDVETKRVRELLRELFEEVLTDEEPLFIGDDATILDVSMSEPVELKQRLSSYYHTPVSEEDLKRPLWKLLRFLNENRNRLQV